ncbi:MAG: HupE/UreJ family protein [Acidobacteriota bacterium]|nr:HupE/UreJ family protein [Acidobacteriota bacterium]
MRSLARRRRWICTVLILVAMLLGGTLWGHPMDERNSSFVRGVEGTALGPVIYLGATHMATGLDHILFLVGVIFFLYRPGDVVLYVSLFTIGHSITLLAGVLAGARVDPYVIDAIIGLSVAYKGFENIGGFDRWRRRPSTRGAVLVFGLFHGLGLATKLQDFTSGGEGLVANIVSFNLGVEIGQILALSIVLVGLMWWRSRPSFGRHAFSTNTVLMALGFTLAGYQIVGSLLY